MKSYLKSEIARAAGVSYRTFQRWLQQQSEQLSQLGVMPRTQLIPARAARKDVFWISQRLKVRMLTPAARANSYLK